ncbi:hypothetical protein [Kutzneria kofuensis]|uniref:Nucleotidyltransferase-like protein n=1 Tax=Kutzneria kofuensis TaxID=103725 RepID=A0A7W9NKC8_9PSEU|nr:hypothetical protein [Kutzneria kofuensis]MBB5896497.1 hypothetical protein [Kutzneria kofuensis]
MTPALHRRSVVTAKDALAVVGLTVDELVACVDREPAEGPRYLVGSLASGFGNDHSDVDVHILVPGLERPVGPRLHHAADVTVDVELYPAAWPAETVARVGAVPTADWLLGRIAMDRVVDGGQRRWLCRWMHAVPLDPQDGPVFSDEEIAVLLPALVREAHDKLLVDAAVALLADAAGRRGAVAYPESARDYLWARAARGLLELFCRAAGDVTTGEKWLPARARRLGLAVPPPGRCADDAAFVLSGLSWSAADIMAAVHIHPASDAAPVELAGRRFLANRHDRLLETWTSASGALGAALEEHEPETLLDAVRSTSCDLVVDEAFVRERLAA